MLFCLLALAACYCADAHHPLDRGPTLQFNVQSPSEVDPHDPYFPAFHPRAHAAHNNDVNGPFFYKGVYHLFMQQALPWAPHWNGAIGWGHLTSTDLVHWKEISAYTGFTDPLVPGRWNDSQYGIPHGGYYSGSAVVVDGVPRLVFPSYFANGVCSNPWQSAGKNLCHFEMQMSVPANLSDPYLAEWEQPVTILRHTDDGIPSWRKDFVWEDPAQPWPDPENPGEWLLITQTDVHNYSTNINDVLLQAWRSKGGSNWTKGWNYLGDFFPGTGDQRCPGQSCGFFTPSFSGGHTFNGFNLYYDGRNEYWLGHYRNGTFVPVTVPRGFDGPEANCFKGFFDESSDRYLIWSWINQGSDGVFQQAWDSMLSITREVRVDADILAVEQYPVEEISLLRDKTLASLSGTLAEGYTHISGVASNQLDIEVSFSWALNGGYIPPGVEVGVSVLMGTEERTLVSLQSGVSMLNATGGNVHATNLLVDSKLSRAQNSTPALPSGVASVSTMPMKASEATLALRVLVDRSVIEAFAQRGRVTSTRRIYPNRTDSSGMAIFYKAPPGSLDGTRIRVQPPNVELTVWEMGKAMDFSRGHIGAEKSSPALFV